MISRAAEKLPPTLRVATGGDQAGYNSITTPLEQTPYAQYAAYDFANVADGRIDPIPRMEDQIRLVNQWDRLMEIQGGSDVPESEYRALYKQGGLRWERVLAYHGAGRMLLRKTRREMGVAQRLSDCDELARR